MQFKLFQFVAVALSISAWPGAAWGQAPSIIKHPVDQVVRSGSAVSFKIEAEGAAPLSYQWRANGTNLPDATQASFRVPACTREDAGLYQVTVSNAVGTVQSAEVSLSVFSFGVSRIPVLPGELSNAPLRFLVGVAGPPLKSYCLLAVSNLTGLEPWQGVCTGVTTLNINTASSELLQRLPTVDESIAGAIIACRAGPDGIDGTEDDMPFRSVSELMARMPPEIAICAQTDFKYLSTMDPSRTGLIDYISDPPIPGPRPGPIPREATVPNRPMRFYRIVLLGDAFKMPGP